MWPFYSDVSHTDLVGIPGDHDDQAEGRACRKGRVLLPLFTAPIAILEGIGNHVTRVTVIPRVQMQSDVCIRTGTTL